MKGSVIDDRLFEILREHDFDGVGMGDTIRRIKEVFGYEELPSLEERRNTFIEKCKPFVEEYGKDMMNSFAYYWLEKGSRDRKFRFEKQKVFEISRRLKTWEKNNKKFSIANMLNKGKK